MICRGNGTAVCVAVQKIMCKKANYVLNSTRGILPTYAQGGLGARKGQFSKHKHETVDLIIRAIRPELRIHGLLTSVIILVIQ